MLKIDITGENQMIFRKEYNGKVFYNTCLSKKNLDGEWENGSIRIQFKKSVDLPDKTKINISEAWLTFYKKDKITVPYIFCNEYNLCEPNLEDVVEITEDDDLPF